MLTVKEINEVSFGKAGFSGYKPEDVDDFIDEVSASFEQLADAKAEAEKRADELTARVSELTAKNKELANKNSEMHTKLAILAEKVESYRKDEDGIKEALLSAQRLARDSVQEAKDKAEIILEDAQNNARKMMDAAKIDASKAAKEYMAQAEAKKSELEAVKRQVSAFRVSLLEMYKKHLECIDHIPNFPQKDAPEAKEQEEMDDSPEPMTKAPVPVAEEPEEEIEYGEIQLPEDADTSYEEDGEDDYEDETTLDDKVDYSEAQTQFTDTMDDDAYLDEDLTEVGIDLNAYADIPETLKKEKRSHYSNLEFGNDVDVSNRKRKK